MNWLHRNRPAAQERSADVVLVDQPPPAAAGPAPATEPAVDNDAMAYGVSVEPAAALPGAWYWRAARVHHLLPAENGGRHQVDVDVLQEIETPAGERVFRRLTGARVRVRWEGGEQILTIAGREDEPGASLPLWREQLCTVEALGLPGARLPSDSVVGVHTGHPRPVGAHPIPHYVLFGPAEQPATMVNLWLAQEYLLAFRPAFGFSRAEAAQAGLVTILADAAAVEPRLVEDLAANGSVVERIAGSSDEVARQLAERVARGERLLSPGLPPRP
jgi:hypothetical protein